MLEFSYPAFKSEFSYPRKVASQGLTVLLTHETRLSPTGRQPRISEAQELLSRGLLLSLLLLSLLLLLLVLLVLLNTVLIQSSAKPLI